MIPPQFTGLPDITTELTLAPCVKYLVQKHKNYVDGTGNWEERRIIICWLRDMGASMSRVIDFLRDNLTPEEFKHSVFEERQVHYLFRRRDIFFPNCSTLQETGVCPVECEFKNNLYIR